MPSSPRAVPRRAAGRTVLVATLLVAALLVAVAGAACSSGGASGDATTSTEPATTSTTTPRPVPARFEGHRSQVYADPAHWVCRPDLDDVCDYGLDATEVAADGTLTEERWQPAEDPPIDCFYVYPTISRDAGANSDLVASPDEEGFTTLNQAARLGSECRVFAPVYRQVTLGSLGTRLSGGDAPAADPDLAYADVRDAFAHYMANDNQGRGVVLIGHSQGCGMLTRLIAEEVDGDEEVRPFLVSAFLAGCAVAVPEDRDVGGSFQHVPLCREQDQTGCVVTWATFRDTAPPPATTFFGKVRGTEDAAAGQTAGQVAACNSPAAPAGGSATLQAYLPSSPTASILASLGATDGDEAAWTTSGGIDTPFVTLPGLLSGECVSRDGVNYLEVHVDGDPADPRADDIGGDLSPEWGLHLVDISLVMGDIVDMVRQQARAG